MPATFTIPLVTPHPGDLISAATIDNEWLNIYNNFIPAGMDGSSGTDVAMQTSTDPFPGGVTSRPTSLQGEIERLRYALQLIVGQTYWYQHAEINLHTLFGAFGGSATQLLMPIGTAAAPSYSFSGDPDTGIYSTGEDNLDFSVHGNGILALTTTSLSPFNPSTIDLGIQATNRWANIWGTNYYGGNGTLSQPTYSFENDQTSGIYRASLGNIGIVSGNSEVMRWDSSGAQIKGSNTLNNIRNVDGAVATPSYTFTNQTGSGMWYRGTSSGEVAFSTAGSLAYRFTGTIHQWYLAGSALIQLQNTNFSPVAASGADLGTNVLYWGTLYVTALQIVESGVGPTMGTIAMAGAASKTINTTSVKANSRIFLTFFNAPTAGNTIYSTNIIAGTSFQIHQTGADAVNVNWLLINVL